MSDNWIVQNLNSALSTWSEKMAELWTLLTENPATFKGGGIWRIMTNINDALTAIAYGLLVLFFAAGIIKTCGSFTDLKKPEHVLKAFIRFAFESTKKSVIKIKKIICNSRENTPGCCGWNKTRIHEKGSDFSQKGTQYTDVFPVKASVYKG